MAQSPAHKFGQIIGDLLEHAIEPLLQEVADRHGLYLDRKGPRVVRGRKATVSWKDAFGNYHDLDFVIERNGSDEQQGLPVAFIESAWRRYTKHSKNKAQEIQGALEPLADCYASCAPFKGAITAGEFTEPALEQLRSFGFHVLHFPYERVIEAFSTVGIDADYGEGTPDSEVRKKVIAFERLESTEVQRIVHYLTESNRSGINQFLSALERCIVRKVERVRLLTLRGMAIELDSIPQAISFVQSLLESAPSQGMAVERYEVEVYYTSGDRVTGQFGTREDTIDFLRERLHPGVPRNHQPQVM